MVVPRLRVIAPIDHAFVRSIFLFRLIVTGYFRANGPSHTSLGQRPRSRAVRRFEGCKPGPCGTRSDVRRLMLRACSPQFHGWDRSPWRCHGLVCWRAVGPEECQVIFWNSLPIPRKFKARLRMSVAPRFLCGCRSPACLLRSWGYPWKDRLKPGLELC